MAGYVVKVERDMRETPLFGGEATVTRIEVSRQEVDTLEDGGGRDA
jgi:hypothetical protein